MYSVIYLCSGIARILAAPDDDDDRRVTDPAAGRCWSPGRLWRPPRRHRLPPPARFPRWASPGRHARLPGRRFAREDLRLHPLPSVFAFVWLWLKKGLSVHLLLIPYLVFFFFFYRGLIRVRIFCDIKYSMCFCRSAPPPTISVFISFFFTLTCASEPSNCFHLWAWSYFFKYRSAFFLFVCYTVIVKFEARQSAKLPFVKSWALKEWAPRALDVCEDGWWNGENVEH